MKKSTLILLTGMVFLGYILTWGLNSPFTMVRADRNQTQDPILIEYLDEIDEEPLKYLELWGKLRSNSSEISNEALGELALRKDAIGYEANLILANHQHLIQLMDTREVKQKYAYYLVDEEKYEEALEVFKDLLPSDAAIIGMMDMGIDEEEVAHFLIEKRHWATALEFLEKRIFQEQETNKKVAFKKQYGRTLAALGLYKDAVAVLEEIEKASPLEPELKWWLGRSLEGIEEINKAKEIYQTLGEGGAYRLGLIVQKEGEDEKAATLFSQSKEGVSLWRGAKLWEELGKQEKALTLYKELATEIGTYQNDAAYRAYILMTRNNDPDASEMLKILENHPSWMNRLGKEPLWETIKDVEVPKPNFLKRVEVFREIGENQLADLELAIGEKTADNLEKLALGDWYLQQGKYNTAVLWGIRALREEKTRRAYELTYLRPYENLVRRAADQYDVDPYLIWAVMREESHYRSDAVSRVGALGLMQIMPTTGKDIAKRLKVSLEVEELLDPETNIEFGAFYIKNMLNMFSGDIDKALAAYNGGPGNVRRWSNSRLGNQEEDFPTAITFLETQQYITKVRNTYYIYRWIYEE